MPIHNPVKSSKPNDPIDLSLLSHILNDAFLNGTYQLQGNFHARTIGYLNGYCNFLKTSGSVIPPELNIFLEEIRDLADYSITLSELERTTGITQVQKNLQILCESIATNILSSRQDQFISLPGGWMTKKGGHAMIYQFKKTANGYMFYINNSGAGLNYHEKISSKKNELYYSVLAYEIPSPVDKSKLIKFIHTLFLAQVPELRKPDAINFDQDKLYNESIPQISFLGGKPAPITDKISHAFIPGQISGTCTQQCIYEMLKAHFVNESKYQQVIYPFQRYALDDYIKQLGGPVLKHPAHKQVQNMLIYGAKALIKTLEEHHESFDPQYIKQQETELTQDLADFKRAPIQPSPTPPIKVSKSVTLFRPAAASTRIPLPSPVRFQPFTMGTLLSSTDLITIDGGDDLIKSLEKMRDHCNRLSDANRHLDAVNQLEAFFINLPIANDRDALTFGYPYKRTKDKVTQFYGAINEDNQDYFHTLLEDCLSLYQKSYDVLLGTARLPDRLIVGLSAIAIVDTISSIVNKPSGHPFVNLMLSNFFHGNCFNPYFASNKPALDLRLQAIKNLYAYNSDYNSTFACYKEVLDKTPLLKTQLEKRYDAEPSQDQELHKLLTIKEKCTALYMLGKIFNELSKDPEFKPLIMNITRLHQYEKMAAIALKDFWKTPPNLALTICVQKISRDFIRLITLGENLLQAEHDRPILTTCKYSFDTKALPDYQNCLFIDYRVERSRLHPAAGWASKEEKLDNQIQLSSNDALPSALESKSVTMTNHQIDSKALYQRELFVLRASPSQQIRLTLDYFRQHIDKLTETGCQTIVEANLFQPNLLLNELELNSTSLLETCQQFIDNGLEHFRTRGFTSQTSLFYIRLSYLLNNYVAHWKVDIGLPRLNSLSNQLTKLLKIEAENSDTAIKYSLNLYQFLTMTSLIELQPNLDKQKQQTILQLIIPSYLYIRANSNNEVSKDSYYDWALIQAKEIYTNLLFKTYDTERAIIDASIKESIVSLALGEMTLFNRLPHRGLYSVRIINHGVFKNYTIDLANGLIFNQDNLAYIATPPNILHHPFMPYLGLGKVDYANISSNQLIVELPDKNCRFIRDMHNPRYRIQREWLVNGQLNQFELYSLDHSPNRMSNTAYPIVYMPIPEILKEKNTHIWVNVLPSTSGFILVKDQRPIYQYDPKSDVVNALDQNSSVPNGYQLSEDNNGCKNQFVFFENPRFIVVCQNQENSFQVELGRYNLTLLGDYVETNKSWSFTLKNNPSWKLIGPLSEIIPGSVGMRFVDDKTNNQYCYLPKQPFIFKKELSQHSEFYHLEADINHQIPENIINDVLKGVLTIPWQYSGTEELITCRINASNQLEAQSPRDALFLCYFYLGNHRPDDAWATLEDCRKRLGGLQGNAEELLMIRWIIECLPYILPGNKDDDATINTPAYIACQLKTLAMFTSVIMPESQLKLSLPEVDEKTPNGLFQMIEARALLAFHKNLNDKLYTFYARYIQMRDHMSAPFQINMTERMSLLNYYYFNLAKNTDQSPKAIGTMAYEWHQLKLEALKKEYQQLDRIKKINEDSFPKAYQNRLDEIDGYIEKDAKIYKKYTPLTLKAINQEIPENLFNAINFIAPRRPEVSNYTYQKQLEAWFNLAEIQPTTPEAKADALRTLEDPDITQEQFLSQLTNYLQLIYQDTKQNDVQEDIRAKIDRCCQHYLIAHSHDNLEQKEKSTTIILFRLLRRITNADIAKLPALKGKISAFMKHVKNLDAPPKIEIYELDDNCPDEVLTGTIDLWANINIPEVKPPTILEHQELPHKFTTQTWIDLSLPDSPIKSELQTKTQLYREHAQVFGVAAQENISLTDAGKLQYDALQKMKTLASEIFNNPEIITAFQKTAGNQLNDLNKLQAAQWTAALTLANSGKKSLKKSLGIAREAITPMTRTKLELLYLQADQTQYAIETGLSETEINQLHLQVSTLLMLSAREQVFKRFVKQAITCLANSDPSNLQQLAHELLTDDLVNYQHETVPALFQYYENVLLRPQQKDAIVRLSSHSSKNEHGFQELIEKIIMGGGKSKVILPLLAFMKATGLNLVVIEVPPALFETNLADLDATSEKLFNQKACPFHFNRESDCTPKNLEFTYNRLINIIHKKDYLVTTGNDVQSLELKYLEILSQKPQNPEEHEIWYEQVSWLNKIVTIFRTRADGLIDEVHQGLLLKKKLNYTSGNKQAIPQILLDEAVKLFLFFDEVKLSSVLGDEYATETLETFLKVNPPVLNDEEWKKVMLHLKQVLSESKHSPVNQLIDKIKPKLNELKRNELFAYLSNETKTIPECIMACKPQTKMVLAFYKEQITQLLSQTLKRKLNEHYGASHQHPDTGLAIPYIANNVPSERSRFGNYLEAINYSIQMRFIEGFRPAMMKSFLKQLQEQARQELLKAPPESGLLENTNTSKEFASWSPELKVHLNQIQLDDDNFESSEVFQALCHNKRLLAEVLKDEVLQQIQIDSAILHSDAFNHVEIYRSCQGVTGTPWNASTFHQSLTYNPKNAAATDEFILSILREKNTAIRQISQNLGLKPFLIDLLNDRNIHAIIDISAFFKGVSNQDVARKLAKIMVNDLSSKHYKNKIKFILFFDNNNRLCALNIKNMSEIITIGSTDPVIITQKLDCSPDERFTYYDQAHTIGIDVKQAPHAKALVLVDQEAHLQNFTQGCLRMRGLQDEQSLDIIVPTGFDVPSLDALIKVMRDNEERQLKQDNFSAAQAKMTNLIRADLMKRLLACQNDVEKQHRYYNLFATYFIDKAQKDFFKEYGDLVLLCNATDILNDLQKRLLEDWQCICKTLETEDQPNTAEVSAIETHMKDIINKALPICELQYFSPTRQAQGKEVEVQKQVEVELQREAQFQREMFDPQLEVNPYKKWNDLPLIRHTWDSPDNKKYELKKDLKIITLTTCCEEISPEWAPGFDKIYMSQNYYLSYKNQTVKLNAFLKPVHGLFFRKHSDGEFDCLILAQNELEYFTKEIIQKETYVDPTIRNFWLTTTQKLVLGGNPPDDLASNAKYQEIIEQVQFFNGELTLMLNESPLTWIKQDTVKKLNFFENHLLMARETKQGHIKMVREALSKRDVAFNMIANDPLANFIDYPWQETEIDELSPSDIAKCNQLAQTFIDINDHWNETIELSAESLIKKYVLPLQTWPYIERYIENRLKPLQNLLRLKIETDCEDIIRTLDDHQLDYFVKNYIPGENYYQQTLLHHMVMQSNAYLNKMNFDALCQIIECLKIHGNDINAVDQDGYTPLERAIQTVPYFASQLIQFFSLKEQHPAIDHIDIWNIVSPAVLEECFQRECFKNNEAFLHVFIKQNNSVDALKQLMKIHKTPIDLFQQLLQETTPSREVLLNYFKGSALLQQNIGVVKTLFKLLNAPAIVSVIEIMLKNKPSIEMLALIIQHHACTADLLKVILSQINLDTPIELHNILKTKIIALQDEELINWLFSNAHIPKEENDFLTIISTTTSTKVFLAMLNHTNMNENILSALINNMSFIKSRLVIYVIHHPAATTTILQKLITNMQIDDHDVIHTLLENSTITSNVGLLGDILRKLEHNDQLRGQFILGCIECENLNPEIYYLHINDTNPSQGKIYQRLLEKHLDIPTWLLKLIFDKSTLNSTTPINDELLCSLFNYVELFSADYFYDLLRFLLDTESSLINFQRIPKTWDRIIRSEQIKLLILSDIKKILSNIPVNEDTNDLIVHLLMSVSESCSQSIAATCGPDLINFILNHQIIYRIHSVKLALLNNQYVIENLDLLRSLLMKCDKSDQDYEVIMKEIINKPNAPIELILQLIIPAPTNIQLIEYILSHKQLTTELINAVIELPEIRNNVKTIDQLFNRLRMTKNERLYQHLADRLIGMKVINPEMIKLPILSLSIIESLFRIYTTDTKYDLYHLVQQFTQIMDLPQEAIHFIVDQLRVHPDCLMLMLNKYTERFETIEALHLFLPMSDADINEWKTKIYYSRDLFTALLHHRIGDHNFKILVLDKALQVIPEDDEFWEKVLVSPSLIEYMILKHQLTPHFINTLIDSPIFKESLALIQLLAHQHRDVINRLIAQHYESHEIIRYLAQQSIASPKSLLQLFNANAAGFQSVNQLDIFIPQTHEAMVGLQNNPAQSAQLFQAILVHPAADEVIKQEALRLALFIFQANDAFWANIPAAVTEINWTTLHLDDMNNQDLTAIFQAIVHIQQLDLRNNNLASKGPGLADLLAILPPALTRIDLRDNDINDKMMKTLHRRIPPTVTEIAYDDRGFVPRLAIQQQFAFNYSFYLKCLAALAVVTGGALLVVGILLANPILIIAGASVAGAGVSTLAGIGVHRLFSNKQKIQPENNPVADDDAVDMDPDGGAPPPPQ